MKINFWIVGLRTLTNIICCRYRKHDRKGIARRVSNVAETETASDPPSPDGNNVTAARPFGIGHPIPMGLAPVCTVINGMPSPVSRSGISAFQPPVPSLKSPTERGPTYSRPEMSHQGPTHASHGFPTFAPSQPMQHVIINNPIPHVLQGHGWPRATIAVDPHFSANKESVSSPHGPPQVRADGTPHAKQESHMHTRSQGLSESHAHARTQGMPIDAAGQQIVVHLKERGEL